MTYSQIERLLRRLDDRFLQRLASYLEFLLWEQNRQATSSQDASPQRSLQDFAGDAPYPDVLVADEELYEQ